MLQETEYTIDDFTILSVIGKGCFGKILLVKEKATGSIFALKSLKKK